MVDSIAVFPIGLAPLPAALHNVNVEFSRDFQKYGQRSSIEFENIVTINKKTFFSHIDLDVENDF